MGSVIVSPHDRMFRSAMSDKNVAREFFLLNLPKKILEKTDLDSLKLCSQSYVDETLKLSQSDILYTVKMAGKTAYLYMLCEHQSKPDILMPYRIIKYEVNIWADHLKQFGGHELPLIVTTVFYNGRDPYTYSRDFRDLLNAPKELIEEVWRQPFRLVDAHDTTDETLREHKWYGTLAFFMGHVYAREFLPYLKHSLAVLKEIEQENGSDYVVTLLNYVLTAAETGNIEEFVETVKQGLSAHTGEKIMTIAEQLIESGIEKGILQGMQQGALEGERTILKKQLMWRFSSIPDKYFEKIDHANTEQLEIFAKKFLEAKTLEDIFESYH